MTVLSWPSEAELDLLAAVLYAASLDTAAGHRVVERITAAGIDHNTFTLKTHQELWMLIRSCTTAGRPVDATCLAAEIDRERQDPRLVARLRTLACTGIAVPFGAVERLAAIVLEASVQREIDAEVIA